jgi:DNA modification methylase
MDVERLAIASISPDPANARRHPERNLEAIVASLRRFGQQKPIVVDQNGVVRAGNGTLEAAVRLGWTEIDVVRTELHGVDATAYAIADNRTGELAEWDEEALARLLHSMRDDGDAAAATGFNERNIQSLITSFLPSGDRTDPQSMDPPATPTTRNGDLWILGRHRLLCGDSASLEAVETLLAGAPVHLVNADPPYNVKVEPRSNNAIAAGLSSFGSTHHQRIDLARNPGCAKPKSKMRPKDRPLANDYVSDEEFRRLLRLWFANLAHPLLPGRAFYIWGGYANCANYPAALAESGLYFSQSIIWVKEHPVLTRKDFMGNHEWCFYGWREGAAHVYLGPDNATDVWSVKKVSQQSMIHLTEKPVELAARAMQYSSRPGEHVLDLFGGSGSTLIAAEQLDRRAFLMELDPPYADVIIDRWQRLTGNQATLDGKSFAEVAVERGSTSGSPDEAASSAKMRCPEVTHVSDVPSERA